MPAPIGAGGEGGIAATMIPALLVSISSTQTKFVLLSVLPLAAGEFGLDNAWTGSVLAMSVGALGTGQLVIGKVVDHLGVRHAATACLLAMAAATAAMAQAQGPEVLLVGSIVRSFFSTSTLPIMTKLIAASVPATEQGRAFGWVSLAGRFGAVVGSTTPAALVALGLVAPGQFRSNLVFSAAFVTLGAVTAFVTYPPKTQETAVLVAHQEQAVGKTATVFSNPTFWLMITANCVLTLVIDVDGFLPMIANDYSPPERLASDSALISSVRPSDCRKRHLRCLHFLLTRSSPACCFVGVSGWYGALSHSRVPRGRSWSRSEPADVHHATWHRRRLRWCSGPPRPG